MKLNNHDPSLRPIIFQLHQILSQSKTLSASELLPIIHQAQSIAQGYDITPDGEEPTNDPITNLPIIFYNLTQELDHLQTKDQVTQASLSFRIQQLRTKVASFCRAIR
jgi:hypothetical protein